MSAEHPEEPSDDEESFDDEIFKPMHHPGKLRIDLQLRVPGEDVTSRRAKRENLDRFMWTCCGATGLDPGCEDGGDQWQGIKDKYPLPEDHGLPPDGDYESELSGNRTGESHLDDDDEEGEEQQVVSVDENDDDDDDEEDDDDDDDDDDDEGEEDEDEKEDDDEDEDDGDDEMDPELEAYLARVNRNDPHWEEELWDEVEEHGEDYYHPGKLVLDADMGEFTPAELRTNRPQRTRPELFYWTCCDGGGNEQGCEERQTGLEPGIKEKYPVPEEEEFYRQRNYRQRKRRRREDYEDEDDEDEDDEDEDDEDEDDEDGDDEY